MVEGRKFIEQLEIICETVGRQRASIRYSLATLLVIGAFALRQYADPVLNERVPFAFFITSAILAAFFGRFGAGLYALIAGWLLADYFFIGPLRTFGDYRGLEVIVILADVVPALIAITLIELLHQARRQARAEILQRRKIEDELREAKKEVDDYAGDLERRVSERTAELQKSVKFLEGFCYSIAHDLRAPLRAMQGFVHLLQQDCAGSLDAAGIEYGRRIVEAARRMDKLVLDLLDYGQLNHVPVQMTELDLNVVVEDVLAGLRSSIQQRGADVQVCSALPPVQGDPNLLALALSHLIANAIKFCDPNVRPKVEICAEQEDGFVKLWIRDNGIGIDPQHQDKIFGLFETLAPSSTLATGAGLAIVSKVAERLGGSVGVQSEPGKGSAFWLQLRKPNRIRRPSRKLQPATKCNGEKMSSASAIHRG